MMNRELSFDIPATYYDRATETFASTPKTLTNHNTVLLLRNTSNIAYPGPLEWRNDSPYAPILSAIENGLRMRKIIDEHIVPLVNLAREIGMQIMYVMDGWAAVTRYPQWQQAKKKWPWTYGYRAPWIKNDGEEEYPWPVSPNTDWLTEHQADVFFPGYAEALDELNDVIDVAPPLAVQPNDWVVSTLPQGYELMCQHGKWNLLHAGFNTNFEMFYSNTLGMMKACKNFRSFLLRDCTTGLERHDTVDTLELTKTSADIMILAMRCYGAEGSSLQQAINEALPTHE
jgi:hypothetical protein